MLATGNLAWLIDISLIPLVTDADSFSHRQFFHSCLSATHTVLEQNNKFGLEDAADLAANVAIG